MTKKQEKSYRRLSIVVGASTDHALRVVADAFDVPISSVVRDLIAEPLDVMLDALVSTRTIVDAAGDPTVVLDQLDAAVGRATSAYERATGGLCHD